MPFLTPDHRPQIQHPQGHPVAVRVAFNVLGDYIPRSFCLADDTEELFKFKISSIRATNEQRLVRIFYCTYDAYGFRNEITLCFDVMRCLWVVG